MICFMSFILSVSLGWNFPLPEDPNFLSAIGPCIADPNCREALTQYLQWMGEMEKKENDPNGYKEPVYWELLDEVQKTLLQAMFEHWLFRDRIKKGFIQPILFDPNEVYLKVYGLNRTLNVETECYMRWWRDEVGYWVDKYYKVYDSSDLNRDGVVNLEDFNLLMRRWPSLRDTRENENE